MCVWRSQIRQDSGPALCKGFEKNLLDGTEVINHNFLQNFEYIGTMKLFILEGRLEFIGN